MYIQRFYALDFFDEHTMPIPLWLDQSRDKDLAWQDFIDAAALYRRHGNNELRMEPRVGYVPEQRFFIFKESNKGTTYVVSTYGIETAANQDVDFAKLANRRRSDADMEAYLKHCDETSEATKLMKKVTP